MCLPSAHIDKETYASDILYHCMSLDILYNLCSAIFSHLEHSGDRFKDTGRQGKIEEPVAGPLLM